MKKILIIGATSTIAQEVARSFATNGAEFFLVARSSKKLAAVAEDLRARSASRVGHYTLDLTMIDGHMRMLDEAAHFLGTFNVALIAHGVLPDQRACEQDPRAALDAINVNATGVIALLIPLANIFEKQKNGCIAVITSVASDRGRQSSYVYSAAKAAVDVFLQGLRNRLFPTGVRVLTIKPGFVDTPMTSHLKKNMLFASPNTVGSAIYRAITHGSQDILYVPWYWWFIMAAIRAIPEPIFKRMKL